MSSQASTGSKHKKILRTRVKIWGKYKLSAEEVFNIDKAEELMHNALDSKTSVQTILKMYGDGLKIGDKGVLAAMHVEFVRYPSITAFISLRESPTLLALCNKDGSNYCVTVIQFKDLHGLEVVCEIIDKQRGIMTKSNGRGTAPSSIPASSLARSEIAAPKPNPPTSIAAPTVIITAEDPPAPAIATIEPPKPAANEVVVTAVVTSNSSSSNGGGLFEKRPFASDITQPPATANVTAVVHASTSSTSAAVVNDDDDNNFRTSIVFGEDTDVLERQRRMESVLIRANASSSVASQAQPARQQDCIDAVILNYDEIDTDGTHAVFDSPDGPPIQLNESAGNLRQRPNRLLVTANSSSSAAASSSSGRGGGGRLVVTNFSSGRSDSPTNSASGQVHARVEGERSGYRTSTVIYRDTLDSPTERPRVSYVNNPRSSTGASIVAAAPPSPQSMQLVRLVPVSSARRKVVQPQQQYFAIQPVSARENGIHLVAK